MKQLSYLQHLREAAAYDHEADQMARQNFMSLRETIRNYRAKAKWHRDQAAALDLDKRLSA